MHSVVLGIHRPGVFGDTGTGIGPALRLPLRCGVSGSGMGFSLGFCFLHEPGIQYSNKFMVSFRWDVIFVHDQARLCRHTGGLASRRNEIVSAKGTQNTAA
jgi:hypothetical protein